VRRISRAWILPVAALALVAGGCSDDGSGSGAPTTTTPAPTSTLAGSITVSDAASLTEAFDRIGAEFMAENPGVDVTFNPGSSATLATQIEGGAPADVFASADEATMDRLVTGDLVDGEPLVFARNRLVIVTEPGNPEDIETLADLPGAGVVALCGETVPCGRYAAELLQRANVTLPETSVTRGQDAKATLAAVTNGDAVAAVVYVTDARTTGERVEAVTIPNAVNVLANYPIAVLRQTGASEAAQAFVDFVLSDTGQTTLRQFGFLPPP
jgi:molybdate transport system substrate-binding protein